MTATGAASPPRQSCSRQSGSAALVISIVPILAVYLALQRGIINGFAGGLRG